MSPPDEALDVATLAPLTMKEGRTLVVRLAMRLLRVAGVTGETGEAGSSGEPMSAPVGEVGSVGDPPGASGSDSKLGRRF